MAKDKPKTSNRTGPAKAGKRKVRLAPEDPRNTASPYSPTYGVRRTRVAKSMAQWAAKRAAAKRAEVEALALAEGRES